MKTFFSIFILLVIFSCRGNSQRKESLLKTDTIPRKEASAKTNDQVDTNCISQNFHPLADTNYVATIKNCPITEVVRRNNAIITFRKGKQMFLKDSLYVRNQNDFLDLKDFNGDGIKDILIFSETGGRGGNAFYYLYLVDVKNKKIDRVKGFENVVNPAYDKKHKVIVAYGLSGTNNYSVYKISKDNKAYQLGKSFEDTFESDADVLDKEITKILNKYNK